MRPTRLAVAGLATDLEPPTQWQRFPTNSMGKFVRTDSRDQFLISIRRTGSDYGVDYITICFPILKPDLKSAKWERDHKIWPDRAITERGKLDLRGGSQWIRVFVYERPQAHYGSAEHWCSVSFNPSRFVDPGGILLCDVTDLQVIVNKALKLIEEYIPLFPDMGPTDIRVKRLDVASNFYGVDSPTRYLRGLTSTQTVRQNKVAVLGSDTASGVEKRSRSSLRQTRTHTRPCAAGHIEVRGGGSSRLAPEKRN